MRWVWAETSGKDGLPERVAAKGRADPLHCPRIDSELFGNDAHTGPPRSRQGLADSFFQCRGIGGRPRRLPSPLTRKPSTICWRGPVGHCRQGARHARIWPGGFLVGRRSACSARRWLRTSLGMREFASAGGVVGFGGKRAAGGTFGCFACDVCFIRSAKFGGGAEFDE